MSILKMPHLVYVWSGFRIMSNDFSGRKQTGALKKVCDKV